MMDWHWPNFTPEEFRCKGMGALELDPDFMDRLQGMRTAFGTPMVVISGYRSPEPNDQVSDSGLSGPHTTGKAVDISVSNGPDRHRLVGLAVQHGFTGIGVQSHGAGRFLHLDTLDAEWGPRPALWSYP